MLNLADFFAPLNFFNLTVFFAFLGSCEVIGFALTKTLIKKIPDFLRGAVWLLGLGLVIFVYFLSHFFIPLAWPAIGICLAVLLIPSSLIYFKEKGWRSLIAFWKESFLPLLFLLPVLPLIFIKVSLPPFIWDEMAYHYISPFTLYYQQVWSFGSGFFENLPRLLETGFTSLFSLTKTYASARLLQFSIFITSLVVVYRFLRENFGFLPAILFFALLLFHNENFLLISTSGYIDVGAASLIMIGIVCFVDFLLKKKIESLILGIAFWGMASGIKYSTLTPMLASFFLVSLLLLRRKMFKKEHLKTYFFAAILFLIMGGYWYVKNFIFLGNPIYPFLFSLFGCKFSSCPSYTFSGWTTSFSLNNLPGIFSRIFVDNLRLQQLFLLSLPLSFLHSNKKVRKVFLFLITIVFLDVFFAAVTSSFEPRYFFHWQFLSVLLIVLPISLFFKKLNWRIVNFIFALFLVFFAVFNSKDFINEIYQIERKAERRIEVDYATGKVNINQWIEQRFPTMKEVIFWCDRSSNIQDLVVFDPSIIWYSYEGLFRVFMTNCNVIYVPSSEQAAPYDDKKDILIASLNNCQPGLEFTNADHIEDKVKYLRNVNNQFICKSKEVLPGLYKFSGE
jgi:hypothetical protein